MIPEHRRAAWLARLHCDEPHAAAILCHGSYARNAAEPHSDLDLAVLVEGVPQATYRSVFEELPDGRLLHHQLLTSPARPNHGDGFSNDEGDPTERPTYDNYVRAQCGSPLDRRVTACP